jgi:exodeoxyribonuclease-3
VRIVTWNVNSIRVRLPRLFALLERHSPDVVCLQETKVVDEDFPRAEIEAAGYRAVVHGQKTYNGVAILARAPASGAGGGGHAPGGNDDSPLQDVARGFAGDPDPSQARAIAATVLGIRVVSLYVPNGKAVGTPSFAHKLHFLQDFAAHVGAIRDSAPPLLIVGDFNVAPEDRDVHDPDRWRGQVLFHPEEQRRLGLLSDLGLRDLLRLKHTDSGIHTWWDYRMGAFHRGWGLRIDLALGADAIASRLRDVVVDRDERKPTSGEGKPSDHAPVIVDLE